MGMIAKEDYIRIRLSAEEKALLKELSEYNGMNMSQYIIQLTRKDKEKVENKKIWRQKMEEAREIERLDTIRREQKEQRQAKKILARLAEVQKLKDLESGQEAEQEKPH